MARARAPYLEWAKSRPIPAIDLARSDLVACPIEEFADPAEAVDLGGANGDGYPPLLDAIGRAYGVSAARVATANGCAGANFLSLAAVIEPGDEVLVESPTYDPLLAAVAMLGGRLTRFERRLDEGYGIDLERLADRLTGHTRLLVVTNPHNPSGVMLPPETVDLLGRMLESHGMLGLVDEVYLDTLPGRRVAPAATRSPALISTSSLTKAYGLSALRCGWALATEELAQRIRRARDVADGSGVLPAEKLAARAFDALDRLGARARTIIEPNRRLWEAFLASTSGLLCAASAAPLAFPRFRDRRSADAFARKLFDEAGVAVVPGSFFGAQDQFRVSLAGATTDLARGLAEISKRI